MGRREWERRQIASDALINARKSLYTRRVFLCVLIKIN